jgi:hypothetical protein
MVMTRRDLLQAHYVDTTIERTRRYLLGGRRFADLSEDGLRALWVDTFLAFAVTDFVVGRFWDTLLDLKCEFHLRRLELPMRAVAAEHAAYRKHLQRRRREDRYDPAAYEHWRAELAALRQRLALPKN